MTRWLYSLLACLALIGVGWVHGSWSDRWGTDVDLIQAAERLEQIPMRLGDWEGKPIATKIGQNIPGVVGNLQRIYTNSRLGVSVTLALVNGRPGPVGTHTPEACYGGAGFVLTRKELCTLPGNENVCLWTSDAVRSRVGEETNLRLFWGWNGGDGWRAAQDARMEYNRFKYPLLHKLYVLRELNRPEKNSLDSREPCISFLNELIPAMEQILKLPPG